MEDRPKRRMPGRSELISEKRLYFSGALIFADDVLLGAVAMDDMNLIVDMREQMLSLSPVRPNFARVLVK